MSISVESVSELEKKLKFVVPAAELDSQIDQKIKELGKQIHISGYRKGHVPEKVIKMRYGTQIRSEVVADVMQKSYESALKEQNINPVGYPHIHEFKEPQPGNDLQFEAVIEVYPEIKIKSLEGIKLEKLATEINETDIDKMLQKLQQEQSKWEEVERAAEFGDRITVDIKEAVGDAEYPDEFVEGVPIVLAEDADPTQVVPGLFKGLLGHTAAEEFELKLKFPKKWHMPENIGKNVKYTFKVKKVEQKFTPELNDEFAEKYFNIKEGGLAALRDDIKANMQKAKDAFIESDLKDQVLTALLRDNRIPIPKQLVDRELESLRKQEEERRQAGANIESNPADLEKSARKRVALGLLLNEIIKIENLQVDQDKVKKEIDSIGERIGNKDMVAQVYYNNKELLAQLEYQVLVDQASDMLIAKAEISEKSGGYDEIMNFKRDLEVEI